jgi:hypothetical protein
MTKQLKNRKMVKKIGLCVAYREKHNNYGTALLGYATQVIIEELGYDTEIIYYEKQRNYLKLLFNAPLILMSGGYKNLINSRQKKESLKKHPNYAKGIEIRTQAVNKYKEKYIIPKMRTYKGFEALKKGSLNYDAILVGSDQVWLPLSMYNKFFNLLFVDNIVPKISYSSSFGVSQIPWWQKKQTKYYLERFDAIAVRELRGKEIVEKLSNQKAQVVLDPTLLVSKENWENHVKDCKLVTTEDFIFCYFLGKNKDSRKAVKELQAKTGLKVVFCPNMDEYIEDDEFFGDFRPYDFSPADFANHIKHAKYVCTDSFHATIFSIHFEKKFVTFYRFNSKSKNSRNSRIDSLFTLLGLKERLDNGNINNQIEKDINYVSVNEKLDKLVVDSNIFLQDNLKRLTNR